MYSALSCKINKNTVKAIQKRIDKGLKEFKIGNSLYIISDSNPDVMPYVKRYINYGKGYVYDYHTTGNIINGIFEPDYMLKKRS